MEKVRNQKKLIKRAKKKQNNHVKKKQCKPSFVILTLGVALIMGTLLLQTKEIIPSGFLFPTNQEKRSTVQAQFIPDQPPKVKIDKVAHQLQSKKRFSEVTVSRSLVGEVLVHVRERNPIAMLRVGDELKYVDRKGNILDDVNQRDDFFNVPIISGLQKEKNMDEKLTEAIHVLEIFSTYSKNNNWSEIHFDNQYDWVIHSISPKVTFVVGKGNFIQKAKRMARVMNKLQLNEDLVHTVDLDFQNRVVVKFKKEEYIDG